MERLKPEGSEEERDLRAEKDGAPGGQDWRGGAGLSNEIRRGERSGVSAGLSWVSDFRLSLMERTCISDRPMVCIRCGRPCGKHAYPIGCRPV